MNCMGMWKLDLHPIIEHRLWKALNNSLPTELTWQIEEFSMQDVVHAEITSKNIDHHPAIAREYAASGFLVF